VRTYVQSLRHASRAPSGLALPFRIGMLAIFALLAASVPANAQENAVDASGSGCRTLRLPVALAAGQPAAYTIHGTLCQPGRARSDVVQVLVHGATYGGYYWDYPYQPERYSYVRWMQRRGYATFTFDRIGIGASSHPASALVDVYSNAYVLHQIVAKLRAGLQGVRGFARVVSVGHSLGTLIAVYEAATYRDVDAVIATGTLHHRSPTASAISTAASYPANQDPKFARAGLDDGYMTTRPQTRGSIFFWQPGTDPLVIAADELLKQTRTATELSTGYTELGRGAALGIDVPVLAVVGRWDLFMCRSELNNDEGSDCTSSKRLLAEEGPNWSPQACVAIGVLHHAGHDINLGRNATTWFAAADGWLDITLGDRRGPRPPCVPRAVSLNGG
jgi:pimeloyl-ACP methyl ester carboxylesterase